MSVDYRVGDTRDVIKTIADGSIDFICSSPPFLALRSYVPADHESKGDEIGSERNPAEFIDMLLELTAEWGRVLAAHGSIAIELGDSYSGSSAQNGNLNGDRLYPDGRGTEGLKYESNKSGPGWPRAKSLALIPQLYAVALAYGINPLTGAPSPAGRWLVRNVIVWHRPNPAVGALGDKVRPSTSYIVVATRSPKRWFDLSAVRSGADSLRPTVAAVASVPDAQEVATTFGARSRNAARGWCQTGSSKIALDTPVTWHTQRLQVVEPIGFLVGVEQHERPQVMDLQSLARPADLTLVAVTAQRILAGDWPVSTSVVGAPALEAGMVIASDIDGPPLPSTLEAAEVVSLRLAPVAGHWLAAEITLDVNGTDATAYAIAPVGGSIPHTNQFTSNHADLGKYRKVGSAGASESRTAGGDFANPDKLRPLSNPAGAPPLDAWFDPYDGTHDTWTLTTQPSRISVKVPTRVPCGPDDGGERTTSPDCPVHGDQADQVPTAPDDVLAADSPLHTSRTDDHRDLGPQRSDACDAETNSCSHRTRSSATPCDKESSRTDLDQSTSAPGTPSAQTVADTARTPESPELSDDHPDTSASSSDEACPRADGHEMAPRSGHTSDPELACSCTFHLEKDSVHSHYAMWPAKLAERLILSMCPREVCRICGEPRRRIETESVGMGGYHQANGGGSRTNGFGRTCHNGETLGWTDCGHTVYEGEICPIEPKCHPQSPYRPGVTLDPFAGSGTTLAVADLHGRDAIGIDFDARNKAIYPARYDEVKRSLFGTPAPMPGQGDLFADEVPV